MVYPLEDKGNSRELEWYTPTSMTVLTVEFVLEGHSRHRGQIQGQNRSDAEEDFWTDDLPGRVTCSQDN